MHGRLPAGVPARTGAASPPALLQVDGLSFAAGGVMLLDAVSLQLRAGECVLLLGPNGAGKSTLLRLIAGEVPPAAGEVRVLGRALTQWHGRELARRRGVLPQHCTVHFPITAAEVVELGMARRLRAPARARLRQELLDWLGLAPLGPRLYPTLSGGEQQRVQLARVLAQVWTTPGPRLLLLDECTSALDPAQQHAVMAMLRRFCHEAGFGVIATTHDLGLAATYADRVMLMRGGRVLADGAPRQTLTPAMLAAVYALRARVHWQPQPSVAVEGALQPPPEALPSGLA